MNGLWNEYVRRAWAEYRTWLSSSAVLAVIGIGLDMFAGARIPGWVWAVALCFGLGRVQFYLWVGEKAARNAAESRLNPSALEFVRRTGEPFDADEKGRKNLRVGIRNNHPNETIRSVSLEVVAANGGRFARVPIILRLRDHKGPSIDIRAGEMAVFTLAKTVPGSASLHLTDFRPDHLVAMPAGRYRLFLRAYAEDVRAKEIVFDVSFDGKERLEGDVVLVREKGAFVDDVALPDTAIPAHATASATVYWGDGDGSGNDGKSDR